MASFLNAFLISSFVAYVVTKCAHRKHKCQWFTSKIALQSVFVVECPRFEALVVVPMVSLQALHSSLAFLAT